VYLWMLRWGNMVLLTTKFLDVATYKIPRPKWHFFYTGRKQLQCLLQVLNYFKQQNHIATYVGNTFPTQDEIQLEKYIPNIYTFSGTVLPTHKPMFSGKSLHISTIATVGLHGGSELKFCRHFLLIPSTYKFSLSQPPLSKLTTLHRNSRYVFVSISLLLHLSWDQTFSSKRCFFGRAMI
jgi:hypothetical protein